MKTFLIIVGIIVSLLLIDFLGNYYSLFSFGFFAPKMENVRRNVFEHTQSYVQGKVQDLSNYKLQMDTTKDEGKKAALRFVIRQQFANFDINNCPEDLRPFLQQVRGF